MLVALYAHAAVDPTSGVMMPPLALPLVVLTTAAYVLFRGAGTWSLDLRSQDTPAA